MSEERLDIFKKCPTCGESFPVLHPDQWAYKRYKGSKGGTRIWFCSYSCMRAYEDKKGRIRGDMKNLTKEQKARAVEIAMTGESPAHYLEDCGVNNPHCSWWYIKRNLEKNDPETYAKLPDKFKQSARNKAVETPEGEFASPAVVKIDGPIRIETPETNKVEVVEAPIGGMCPPPEPQEAEDDNLVMVKVQSKKTGNLYEWSKQYDLFSVTSHGDEMSLCIEDWQKLLAEMPKIARKLGVEL